VASINEIILRSANPFDRNQKATSFWSENQESELVIDSIHAEVIEEAADMLAQLQQVRSVKTLMVMGDAGSGKTYLLGRLKNALNANAYFAYIQPFPKSDHIWRHILRETVDSLVQIPDGQKESQLLLWLKNLSIFKKSSLLDKLTKVPIWDLLKSDRQKGRQDFIKKISSLFKRAGIFNAEEFFGVLFDLTDPDLESVACNWLKGDSISEESLKELHVKSCIEDEDTAKNILANFGKISAETQPIVICFDQLESIDKLPDGLIDLPSLFTVNTLIHTSFKNFFVIISIATNSWMENKGRIVPSDRDRIDKIIELNSIDLDQAEAICMTRLHHLHHQSIPIPTSSIYPLTRQYLEANFPMGETNPRRVLACGRNIFQEYKKWLIADGQGEFTRLHQEILKPEENIADTLAHFKLIWIDELHKVRANVNQINQISMLVLMEMLQIMLRTLQINVQSNFLPSPKFTIHSFSLQHTDSSSKQPRQIGVIWTEHEDMAAFFHIMNACQKAVEYGSPLYLIRFATVGKPTTKGNKIYNQIFAGDRHRHIQPDLDSIHLLATYYNLVKEAREGDLLVGGKTLKLSELEDLIRQSEILNSCTLLQKLGVIAGIKPSKIISEPDGKTTSDPEPIPPIKPHTQIQEFVLNLLKTQQLIGLSLLINSTLNQFSQTERSQVEQIIEQLCQEKRTQILNPQAPIEAQLICLVASNS